VRDVLIGITIVLADGTLTHGGGRVVKNVAGYDLMKLFTGSWGTLGIIVEATFKLQPLPAHEAVFVLPTTGTNAACALAVDILHAPVAPQFVEALNRCGAASVGLDGAAVVVGCGGTREEIAAQQQRLQERLGQGAVRVCNPTEAAQLYARLRDFPARRALALPAHPLGSSQQDCWGCKLSALPSHLAPLLAGIEAEAARQDIELAVLSHVGSGVAFVRCSVPTDENVLLSFAGWLETAARAAGGWAVFDLLPPGVKNRIDPWGTTPPGLTLMRGIKQTLDPNARLSPGRFVGGI
jgi:glycolate oxidase FAD binding subunit